MSKKEPGGVNPEEPGPELRQLAGDFFAKRAEGIDKRLSEERRKAMAEKVPQAAIPSHLAGWHTSRTRSLSNAYLSSAFRAYRWLGRVPGAEELDWIREETKEIVRASVAGGVAELENFAVRTGADVRLAVAVLGDVPRGICPEIERGLRSGVAALLRPAAATSNNPSAAGASPLHPNPSPLPPNACRRSGKIWTIRFRGREMQLTDSRRLFYVVAALKNPGVRLPPVFLIGAAANRKGRIPTITIERGAARIQEGGTFVSPEDLYQGYESMDPPDDGLRRGEPAFGENKMDEPGIRKLRNEQEKLDAEIRLATKKGRSKEADRLTRQRLQIAAELKRACGLAGRRRRMPSPAERAKKAVTQSIYNFRKSLQGDLPELAAHLKDHLEPGRTMYSPPPGVDWVISD